MKTKQIKRLLTGVAVLAVGLSHAAQADKIQLQKQGFQLPSGMNADVQNRNQVVDIFIELELPSVAEYVAKQIKETGNEPSRDEQMAYAKRISAQQQSVLKQLQSVEETHHISTLRVGANGFKCRTSQSKIDMIRLLPGVKDVKSVAYHETMSVEAKASANASMNMERDTRYTGKDIVIAIVDTGIDYYHAAFGGSGNPEDFASDNPNIVEDGSFPTDKVIGGIDLAGPDYNVDGVFIPQPDADPLDLLFHGSVQASIVAGLGVEGELEPGIAPDAKLLAVKVFGDGLLGGPTALVADGIEYSLDPNRDGSVDDRVDIINLSIGRSFGKAGAGSSDYDTAVSNAVGLGVTFVGAAGNEGAVPYIQSGPAVYDGIISVGASESEPFSDDLEFHIALKGTGLSENGVPPRIPASYVILGPDLEDLTPFNAELVAAEPIDSCEPLGEGFQDKVVLYKDPGFRVPCENGNDREDLILDSGAKGIVYFNDDDFRYLPIGDDIPAVGITREFGAALQHALSSGVDIEVEFSAENNFVDVTAVDTVALFSSSGPARGTQSFKPDVIAPGVNITGPYPGTGTGTLALSGTSQSAPVIAGLAALLKERDRSLSSQAIKAIVQNTTRNAHIGGPGSSVGYPLSRQGVGIAQIEEALRAESFVAPGGISFGRLNPVYHESAVQNITLTNNSDVAKTYSVKLNESQSMRGVSIHVPRSIYVRPQSEKIVSLVLRANPREMRPDNGNVSQTEIDGWVTFDDGSDSLRVGYMAVVDPASDVDVYGGSGFGQIVVNSGMGAGIAEAFTDLEAYQFSPEPSDLFPSIKAFGYRTAIRDGEEVFEFAIATERPFNTLSAYSIFLPIYSSIDFETGEFGDFTAVIEVSDDLGTDIFTGAAESEIVSRAQIPFEESVTLFPAKTDFNDNWIIFTVPRVGPLGISSEGQKNIFWGLYLQERFGSEVTGGEYIFLAGEIDLDAEVKLSEASLELNFGESAWVRNLLQTDQDTLWLFPNNQNEDQSIFSD